MKKSKGIIRSYSSIYLALHKGTDLFVIIGGLWLITRLFNVSWQNAYTIAAFTTLLLFILVAEVNGLYGFWRFTNLKQELNQVIITWLWVIFGLLVLAYAAKISSVYSRRVMLAWISLTPVLLILARTVLRWCLNRFSKLEANKQSIAIVGAGKQAIMVANELRHNRQFNARIIGFYDDDIAIGHQLTPSFSQTVIGKVDDVIKKAKDHSFDIIFIALPLKDGLKIKKLIEKLTDTTVMTYVVPDLFLSDLLQSRWGYFGKVPVLSIHERPFMGIDGWVKRIEDIILGSIILIIISIPMLFIAIAIKTTSRGPIIFKQRRYGISGEEIEVWKFRSMKVTEDGAIIKQAQKDDPRITPLGAFLRKYSLDEFPQFINVLQGHMSIVGPRPHAVAHNELYRKEIEGYMLRHTIKPGITGWAQINGWRGETDTIVKMEKRVEYDLWYIRNWSIWLDIKIILRTPLHMFISKEAF